MITSGTHAVATRFIIHGHNIHSSIAPFAPFSVYVGTAFLCHSAPRGTVFTDGSPEFAFIACHGSHASLIRTHLSHGSSFLVSLSVRSFPVLPRYTRDKGPWYIYRRRTERAKRRHKSSGTREKKERKRKRKGEGGRRGRYRSSSLRKRGHPPISWRTRKVIYFSRSPPTRTPFRGPLHTSPCTR